MTHADGTADGDEHGICVAGIGSDHDLYVVHCEGMRATRLGAKTRDRSRPDTGR